MLGCLCFLFIFCFLLSALSLERNTVESDVKLQKKHGFIPFYLHMCYIFFLLPFFV